MTDELVQVETDAQKRARLGLGPSASPFGAGLPEGEETDAEKRARLGLAPAPSPFGRGHGGGLYMPNLKGGGK